jgi:hypothetical protein
MNADKLPYHQEDLNHNLIGKKQQPPELANPFHFKRIYRLNFLFA